MSERRGSPVLVYDGDCGICTRSVEFVERHLTGDLQIVAFQDADLDSLGVTAKECEEAVQFVRPDGVTSRAHLAAGAVLTACGLPWSALGWLAQTPPSSWLAAAAYRWVAKNRHRLPGGTPACSMPPHLRPGTDYPDAPGTAAAGTETDDA